MTSLSRTYRSPKIATRGLALRRDVHGVEQRRGLLDGILLRSRSLEGGTRISSASAIAASVAPGDLSYGRRRQPTLRRSPPTRYALYSVHRGPPWRDPGRRCPRRYTCTLSMPPASASSRVFRNGANMPDVAGERRAGHPERGKGGIQAVPPDVVDRLLRDDVQRKALTGVLPHGFADDHGVFFQESRVHTLPPQDGHQEGIHQRVPDGVQERPAAELRAARRDGSARGPRGRPGSRGRLGAAASALGVAGSALPLGAVSLGGRGFAVRPAMVPEGGDACLDPGLVSQRRVVIVELQDEIRLAASRRGCAGNTPGQSCPGCI